MTSTLVRGAGIALALGAFAVATGCNGGGGVSVAPRAVPAPVASPAVGGTLCGAARQVAASKRAVQCGGAGSGATAFPTVAPGAPAESQEDALLPPPGTPLPLPAAMPTPSAPAGSSAASNVRRLKNLEFTALPVPFPLGAVAALAISPVDGSLYAVSQTSPAGMAPDGFIYHLVGSTWINMPGIASSIAVGADGVVYAVAASQHGQVYAYVPAGWSPGTGATPIPGGPTWYPLVSYNGAQGTSSGQLPSPQPVAASQVIAASLGGTTDFPVILASAAPGADAAVYTWGTTISGDPYCARGQMPGAGISLARGSSAVGSPYPPPRLRGRRCTPGSRVASSS